jgi:spore coat polysaccharide biosynthesis protein SpsF
VPIASSNLTVVGVIQARTGSTRLPGKVLRPLAGRSVLGWIVRAAQLSGIDDLVVATTTESGDDAVVAECRALGVDVVRGSVDDVLARFVQAVDGRHADAVARFTADCPMLDPAVAGAVIDTWRRMPALDYVSTAMPRCVPRGMDAEIMSIGTLLRVNETAVDHHRVHVTSGIYSAPDEHRMVGLRIHPDTSDLRVTLDTEDDWHLIQKLVAEFGDRPAVLVEIVAWLRANPDAVALNQHVRQKALEVG